MWCNSKTGILIYMHLQNKIYSLLLLLSSVQLYTKKSRQHFVNVFSCNLIMLYSNIVKQKPLSLSLSVTRLSGVKVTVSTTGSCRSKRLRLKLFCQLMMTFTFDLTRSNLPSGEGKTSLIRQKLQFRNIPQHNIWHSWFHLSGNLKM